MRDNSGIIVGSVKGALSISNGKISVDGKDVSRLKCPCGNKSNWHYISTTKENTKARCAVCHQESTF